MFEQKRKRGRPRISRVGPTDEWLRKARAKVGDGADLTLAEYPLGILLARKIITQAQHDAGLHYSYLYGRIFGCTTPVKLSEGRGRIEIDDDKLANIEIAYTRAANKLRKLACKHIVDDIVVFKQFRMATPQFLRGIKALTKWRYNGE